MTPTLQLCSEGPLQTAPPFAGAGLVQVRVCVPPLPSSVQLTLQSDQSLQPPSIAHSTLTLHACELAPAQSAPPFAGAGLVHVRVCVPPLPSAVHITLHADQALKPPLIAHSTLTLHACELAPVQ